MSNDKEMGNCMEGPSGHCAKRNKSEKDKYCMNAVMCGI